MVFCQTARYRVSDDHRHVCMHSSSHACMNRCARVYERTFMSSQAHTCTGICTSAHAQAVLTPSTANVLPLSLATPPRSPRWRHSWLDRSARPHVRAPIATHLRVHVHTRMGASVHPYVPVSARPPVRPPIGICARFGVCAEGRHSSQGVVERCRRSCSTSQQTPPMTHLCGWGRASPLETCQLECLACFMGPTSGTPWAKGTAEVALWPH